MSRKNLHLVRHQLDETLELFDPVFDLAPPSKGWIRTIVLQLMRLASY